MNTPVETQALIRGDLIVSSDSAGRCCALFLLDNPLIDYSPADEGSAACSHMRNCWDTRDFSGENVRQMRP
jgi:hypothetical protein